MINELKDSISTTQLGGFCPYWTKLNGKVIVGDTAEEIINFIPEDKRIIDPAGVAEFLQFGYMFGTRTLVKGVNRMPWRATLNKKIFLERKKPIPHLNLKISYEIIAKNLIKLLEKEMINITKDYDNIYLLLSGGLDSRIVAGILKKIEKDVIVVNWGLKKSRDVVYSKKIANMYEWKYIHIPYDIELTKSNIKRGAIWGGSETVGYHLHGLEWFRNNVDKEDLVLAGSFGDSVGRAEFSGNHLTNLRLVPIDNANSLMKESVFNNVKDLIVKDRANAWEKETGSFDYAYLELDKQENYMRRMINHIICYVCQFCDMYQAFTSDEILKYMWSIHPECRKNDIYRYLLKNLDNKLYSLPWARNGIALDGTKEDDDSLVRNYHEAGRWLKKDLLSFIKKNVFSDKFELLNWDNVDKLWDEWIKNQSYSLYLADQVTKICSLNLSKEHFNLK